jgi:hypothetical protein
MVKCGYFLANVIGNPRLPTRVGNLSESLRLRRCPELSRPESDGSSIFLHFFLLLSGLMRCHPYSQRAYAEADREAERHRA